MPWSPLTRPWEMARPLGTDGAPADWTPEIIVLVDATAPPRKLTNWVLICARLLPFSPDTALLLLVCSWFTQVVILPHTWLAHWLAVRLAWVDDVPDPLELDPPLQAANVRPAASATAEANPILPARRGSCDPARRAGDHASIWNPRPCSGRAA